MDHSSYYDFTPATYLASSASSSASPSPVSRMSSLDDSLQRRLALHQHHSSADDSYSTATLLQASLSRPLTHQEHDRLANLDRLKQFLATAPSAWNVPSSSPPSLAHPALNRFLLPNQEYVTCVLWSGLYHITGTDIVRALVFRFEAFGRPVRNMKKFEEGVFSDLRNLKPGLDACLEEPKSPFLDLLFKYQCIRTQKKQKVFYWYSVPHDRLFLDALERDLKREKMGLEPTTVVAGEPAQSFTYDPKRTLWEQFSKPASANPDSDDAADQEDSNDKSAADDSNRAGPNPAFLSMFSLFEGSPSYKTRRRRQPKTRRSSPDMVPPYPGAAAATYRPIDDAQIRPSVAHELGVGLSASDAFLAQANTSRFLPPLDPPVRHNTYPLYNPVSASYEQPQPQTQQQQQTTRTVRAYACPLFSCGRLFKRTEHLKRHVRTHTLERPFPCQRCNKRFARADNLQQHLRIHARADELGVQAPSVEDDGGDEGFEDEPRVVELELRSPADLPEGGLTPPPSLLNHHSLHHHQQGPISAPAPSQEGFFDPGAVYAWPQPHQQQSFLDSAVGPVRRHRSATPAELIRRPATSAAYHPYAVPSSSSSSQSSSQQQQSHSTRSSPATYTMSLDYGVPAYPGVFGTAVPTTAAAATGYDGSAFGTQTFFEGQVQTQQVPTGGFFGEGQQAVVL